MGFEWHEAACSTATLPLFPFRACPGPTPSRRTSHTRPVGQAMAMPWVQLFAASR
jgi:hypothetical protein